jgi:hypothetical protein
MKKLIFIFFATCSVSSLPSMAASWGCTRIEGLAPGFHLVQMTTVDIETVVKDLPFTQKKSYFGVGREITVENLDYKNRKSDYDYFISIFNRKFQAGKTVQFKKDLTLTYVAPPLDPHSYKSVGQKVGTPLETSSGRGIDHYHFTPFTAGEIRFPLPILNVFDNYDPNSTANLRDFTWNMPHNFLCNVTLREKSELTEILAGYELKIKNVEIAGGLHTNEQYRHGEVYTRGVRLNFADKNIDSIQCIKVQPHMYSLTCELYYPTQVLGSLTLREVIESFESIFNL